MNSAIDINYFHLFLGYILIIIPIIAFNYYKTGLVKPTLIGIARMTVQLFLVGLYLEYIFSWNLWWLNLTWAVIMVFVASIDVVRRSNIDAKLFFIPVVLSLGISLFLIDVYFLKVIIDLDNIFDARYFIPITGMMLGNCLKANIMALNSFYTGLQKENTLYRYQLANGATRNEALRPFMREAMQVAFNPLIATTAITGLIALPGMMTGQILGGSSPNVAIKYQILIILTILVASILSVIITITLANRFAFDEFDNLRPEILKNEKK